MLEEEKISKEFAKNLERFEKNKQNYSEYKNKNEKEFYKNVIAPTEKLCKNINNIANNADSLFEKSTGTTININTEA